MIKLITYPSSDKNVPTIYYTNKVEFGTKMQSENKVIFWDIEIKNWIVIDIQEILCIIG